MCCSVSLEQCIDYSRCILGFCLTLEAPSSVSVGLCLTHGVFDKEDLLEKHAIKTQWPIWGKPNAIHVDNAAEFHSEALKRGCEAHGIEIIYRPRGKPHYGGIVERVIGTFMQRDLSHIYVLEPHSNRYLAVPYRTISRPTITLWEHKSAIDWLHERGFHRRHETIIFQAIERMREIIKTAGNKSKAGGN